MFLSLITLTVKSVEEVEFVHTAHDKDPLSEHLCSCFRQMSIRFTCKKINYFKDMFKIFRELFFQM